MARPTPLPAPENAADQAHLPVPLPPAPPPPPAEVTSPALPDGALGHANLPDWFIPL